MSPFINKLLYIDSYLHIIILATQKSISKLVRGRRIIGWFKLELKSNNLYNEYKKLTGT